MPFGTVLSLSTSGSSLLTDIFSAVFWAAPSMAALSRLGAAGFDAVPSADVGDEGVGVFEADPFV